MQAGFQSRDFQEPDCRSTILEFRVTVRSCDAVAKNQASHVFSPDQSNLRQGIPSVSAIERNPSHFNSNNQPLRSNGSLTRRATIGVTICLPGV